VTAIGNTRAVSRQFLLPALDLLGRAMEGADDQSIIIGKSVLPAHVHQNRRRGRTKTLIELLR
jgi:hypothetical protein